MSFVLRRRPATRVPPPGRLVGRNSLASGLRAFYVLREGYPWYVNLVTGEIGGTVAGSGVEWHEGLMRTPGSAGSGVLLSTGSASNATPISFVYGLRHGSGVVDWSLMADEFTWTGWYHENDTLKTTNANSFDGAVTFGGSLLDGVYRYAASMRAPNDLAGKAFGASRQSDTGANAPSAFVRDVALGWSRRSVDDNAALAYFEYFGVFDRDLTPGEQDDLTDCPWIVFDERIWVPVSAGGGGSTTVTVDSASIALSGQSVTTSTSVPVTASALSLTGSSVPLTQTIAVDSSAITLTGQSVTNTTTIPVTAGSVTLTGSEISVTVGGDTTVTVDSGTLSLTGQTVTNTVSVPVSAASVTLSGQTITGTTIIPVTAGTVSLTGGDITITYSGPSTTTVSVDPASLILVGQSIDVSYSGRTGGGAAKAKLKKKKRKFQTQTPDETLEALVEQLKEDKKPVLKQVKEIVEEVKELIEESSEDSDKEEAEEKHETLETTTVMFFVASLINKTNEAVETMQRFETKLGRLEASLKKIEQSARNAEELALLLYSER